MGNYIKTLILSTIMLIIGNNSNYCYSMDDIDSNEIVTNNTMKHINFFEYDESLQEQTYKLEKNIKKRLPQLSEQANSLLRKYLFTYEYLIKKIVEIKFKNSDDIRLFHKDELIGMFSEAEYFKNNTITFCQLLTFIINKMMFDSIENMKNIQKIIDDYNTNKEQRLSHEMLSNKNINSNDSKYSNNIENKLIFEILLLNDKLYNNINNFVEFTKKLKLNNISSNTIEEMEYIIDEIDFRRDNLYHYRLLKDYNFENYKSLLESDERLLNNNIDCDYFEVFSKLCNSFSEYSNNIMAFYKEVVKTHGLISNIIDGMSTSKIVESNLTSREINILGTENEIPINGNSIKWDRQYINKETDGIFNLNIKNGEKVSFTQLLKYFANKITLVSLNMVYFQINNSVINNEKDFNKILLDNIKEISKTIEKLSEFIGNELNKDEFKPNDIEEQELHQERINIIKSWLTNRMNYIRKLIQELDIHNQ